MNKIENVNKDFNEETYKKIIQKRKEYYQAIKEKRKEHYIKNKENLKLYYQNRKELISENHKKLNPSEKYALKQYNRMYYKNNQRYHCKRKVINQPIANISTGKFIIEL